MDEAKSVTMSRDTAVMIDGFVTDEFMNGVIDYSKYIKWKMVFENLVDNGLFREGTVVELRITNG